MIKNLYRIPDTLIKEIKFLGDGQLYDREIFKFGQGKNKFIVVNPDAQISFDWEQELKYYIPPLSLNFGSCLVITHQDNWVAKIFTKNWDKVFNYKFYNIQKPSKTIDRFNWSTNQSLSKNIKFVNDPKINFKFNVYDKHYRLIWYIDPKITNNKEIWAYTCEHKNVEILGDKHMGFLSLDVQKNKDLEYINFNIDNFPCYFDSDYQYDLIWYLDSKFTDNQTDKIWAYRLISNESIGTKNMGNVSPILPEKLDVIFISYYQPHAEKNWNRVLEKAPWAKRIDGVTGIDNAHKAAASISNTDMFYVVDGDAWLVDNWDFNFQPGVFDRDCTHIWYSKNPINGLEYGYGGIKLFSKKQVLDLTSWNTLDFTNAVSGKVKVMNKVSNITKFDTDPFSVWKSVVRECVKLKQILSLGYDEDSEYRLQKWLTDSEHPLNKYAVNGAKFALKLEDNFISNINNFDWLKKEFERENVNT